MTPGDIGAAVELTVAADLIKKGWEVFRNLSPNGECDLVIKRAGRLFTVQVKSGGFGAKYEQAANDIVASYRDGVIRYVGFNRRAFYFQPKRFLFDINDLNRFIESEKVGAGLNP